MRSKIANAIITAKDVKPMEKYTVLICDDSKAIHDGLTSYLTEQKFDVISAYDGESALEQMRRQSVDVVLLDIMLPGIDGYEVCREIRKSSDDVYIMMLSAKGEEFDKILGLELGADDYVTKPFSPREVTIRIKRAMKRLNPKNELKKFSVAELTVLPDSYQVFVKGEEVRLSPKEFEVLLYMVSNAGKVLTRELILNAAWDYDYFGDTRVIDTMIRTLRQKLIKDGVHFTISTIYGVGYRIEEKM